MMGAPCHSRRRRGMWAGDGDGNGVRWGLEGEETGQEETMAKTGGKAGREGVNTCTNTAYV